MFKQYFGTNTLDQSFQITRTNQVCFLPFLVEAEKTMTSTAARGVNTPPNPAQNE